MYCNIAIHTTYRGVTIQWTGLLDWNTGLDYWTDILFVFTHSTVGFTEFHKLERLQPTTKWPSVSDLRWTHRPTGLARGLVSQTELETA